MPDVTFVHCFVCRLPVTPAFGRPLMTLPPTGDRRAADALCAIVRGGMAR